nr:transposase (putative), gypsy type [Tanacetum cinerariifolium]
MGRDTIQLETAVSTISQEYLLEFTSEYSISEDVHPELPSLEDRIVDVPEGKVGVYIKFFEYANFRIPLSQFLFDIFGHYQIHLSQLSVIGAAKVAKGGCRLANDQERTPHNVIQNRWTPLRTGIIDFSGWTKEYFLPPWTGAHMLRRMRCQQRTPTLDMDLSNLISALNPSKVKTGLRPRAAHEVPLLTATASRVIDIEDPDAATESSGTPSTVEKSPPNFDNENPASPMTEGAASEVREEEVAALEPRVSKKRGRRGNNGADANEPPKVLRKDYASVRPEQSTRRGKSLPAMRLAAGATFITPADTKGVNDPDPLSYAEPQPHLESYEIPTGNVATMEVQDTRSAKSAGSGKSTSSPSMVGLPRKIYQPGWGVTNSCRLDTPYACQYVALGSQLRLRFEQEVRLLNKARAQIARREQRIQVREEEIKKLDQEIQGLQNQTSNLNTFLEAETDMKKAAETKNANLTNELESLLAFKEFKKYEYDRVEKRCAEMDARLDVLSIDFDEELYPHMLTAIAGRRWVIGHGLRLAVMKCGESTKLRQVFADVVFARIAKGMSEGLKYRVEHGKANLDLEVIEAYDSEAETKYVAALHTLRDLNYPMVDQLELLKDAPIDVVMASLHLENDSGEDAPYWIRELRPSSSQLKIPVYPEVRDPKDPWAFKEEILLADAIAANVSHAEKKKKCRVVCRTHGVSFAHHARCDGVLVSVPTVAPQGLAILLADAATQTETSKDGGSPRLLRSNSLPVMYNLD